MAAFARVGYVPEILKPLLVEMLNKGQTETKDAQSYEETVEWFKFLDSLCEFAFVEPSVGSQEDQITLDDIDLADKMFIFRFFGRPADEIASFRSQQEKSIQPLATPEKFRNTDKQAPWSAEVGKFDNWDEGPLDSSSG